MIVAASRIRVLAVLLVAIMMGPVFPMGAATHASSQTPGIPDLPHAEPTSTCIGLGVPADVLKRMNERPGFGFRDKEGVPSLCRLDGRPMDEWTSLVRQLDATLQAYRDLANELDRLYRERLDYTLPEGPCAPGDAIGDENTAVCPLLRPQVTLLEDTFDGRRLGGFGEWQVVTDGTEAEAWRPSSTVTNNGTQHTWRFGEATGYARGAHQWLVSPQVDLGAVRGDPGIVGTLVSAHVTARGFIRSSCTAENNPLRGFCEDNPELASTLIEAYEGSIDAYTLGLAVGQQAVTLDLTYRLNMADGEDGVRVWLWAGQEPPSRTQLYDLRHFGHEPTSLRCNPPAVGSLPPNDVQDTFCWPVAGPEGAAFPLVPPGAKDATAFQDVDRAALPGSSDALSGDLRDFVTVRVNLTDFAGQRVWFLFEVMTLPDLGRGEDYFGDRARFPRAEDFGFELARVNVVGDAYPRNLRLNDVTSAFPRIPANNPYGDKRDVRTDVPPGRDVVARVHNAGGYVENATLTLQFLVNDYEGSTPVGEFVKLADPVSVRVVNLIPGEAREVRVPWPKGLDEDSLYQVSAKLTADDLRQVPLQTEGIANPETTPVRPRNQADPGNDTGVLRLRAYTDHRLSTQHYPASEMGPALEVCSSVSPLTGCAPLEIAAKGERRVLLVGVRNDGSLPEDASATLDLRLDGADMASVIQGGARRDIADLLPGEVRPVTWELAPAEAGAYEATVILRLANGTAIGEPAKRLVFVQRSTGVICFDDMGESRECGPSFAALRPDELRNQDVSAFAIDPAGALYVATNITPTSGGLWRLLPGGAWTQIEDLSGDSLDGRVGRPRPDVGFAPIQEMTFAPDGTLYMAGLNGTLLVRPPDGKGPLSSVPFEQPPSPPFRALAGAATQEILAGKPAWLVGGGEHGVAPYTGFWRIDAQPAGGDGSFPDPLGALALQTHFTATVPGVYTLIVNVTDATGAPAESTVRVTVVPPPPSCIVGAQGQVETRTFLGGDPADSALPGAVDILCVTVRHAGSEVTVSWHLRDANALPTPTTKAKYNLSFTSSGVRFAVTATRDGSSFTVAHDPNNWGATFTKGGNVISAKFTAPLQNAPLEDIKVEACAPDPCSAGDALDGGPYAYSLATDVVVPPAVATPKASFNLTNGTTVDLDWTAVPGADRYRITRGIPGQSDASVLAEVLAPATRYRDTDVPQDTPLAYRVVAVDEAGNLAAPSKPGIAASRSLRPDHHAVVVWNGTVFVGGIRGEAWWLNETSGQLERFTLRMKSPVDGSPVDISGTITSFQVAADGKRVYAGTTSGAILLNEGHGASWRTTWNDTKVPLQGASILDLGLHEGGLLAVGAHATLGGVILRPKTKATFELLEAPEVIASRPAILAMASREDGRLFLQLDHETFPLATCQDCFGGADEPWAFPAAPLPNIVRDGITRRAGVVSFATLGGTMMALLEGGTLLDYASRGAYANEDDWSVIPALRANDGGAYQARLAAAGPTTDEILRFEPVSGTKTTGWSQLRITYHHQVARFVTVINEQTAPRLRVFYQPVPSETLAVTNVPSTCSPRLTNGVNCLRVTDGAVGDEQLIMTTSNSGGWTKGELLLGVPDVNGSVQTAATFVAVEFAIPSLTALNWVVDDVRVEAYFPDSGKWSDLVLWRGPADVGKTTKAPLEIGSGQYWNHVTEPLDIDSISPWHLSLDIADEPVWVANNEVLPGHVGGSSPRLLWDWDSRLVSPVIDLSQAFDPVISFRHAYAFKTLFYSGVSKMKVGDGGWVEIQYEMSGEECGSSDPATKCWSRFYHACPEQPADLELAEELQLFSPVGGCKKGTGYPRPKDLGVQGMIIDPNDLAHGDPYGHRIGFPSLPAGPATDITPAFSFWGRTVLPNKEGVIEAIRATEDYEQVDIVLQRQNITDEDGNSVNITGRRIRVGFHILTSPRTGMWDYQDEATQASTPTTFPGEGWYITDFKVRGASQLGMDLVASELRPRVGYDWPRLGVGPGMRVPINVTVQNAGRFEVGGYTGTLEVRRVEDAALGITTLVESVPLTLQPLIEPGKARNHTFVWSVPEAEGASYVLGFTVVPQGIARDEDPTDNVVKLGSLTRPLEAVTRASYESVVIPSPAEATKDITRFLPIYVSNTGNTVLGDNVDGVQQYFRVTRRILQLGTQTPLSTEDCDEWNARGRPGPMVDCRVWNTSVPLVFGTTLSLASVSTDVNPATDFFWKPPTSADYRILVSTELLERRPASLPQKADANAVGVDGKALTAPLAERVARSFDTYIFDDAELGPRGLGLQGAWEFGPGWGEVEPGFRSPRAYGFGDPVLLRYTADVDTSLSSPTIDLGTARSARFALYHRYKFEPGYDGGVIEASVDGGKTWRRLQPMRDEVNGLPEGYAHAAPIAASSPLHLTGAPWEGTKDTAENRTLAFTGDSSKLPQAIDGWVLSVFDLTNYDAITESDVPYEMYDAAALAQFTNGTGQKDPAFLPGATALPTYPSATSRTYIESNWVVGRIDEYQYWETQNLAEDTVVPRGKDDGDHEGQTLPDTFLWSGSASLVDDQVRPAKNVWLTIDVKDAIAAAQPGDRVVVEWWEWIDRTGTAIVGLTSDPLGASSPRPSETRGVWAWSGSTPNANSYHFNLTRPNILARQGNWMHLQSDITEWVVPSDEGPAIGDISFVYTPYRVPPSGDIGTGHRDDRGFVVDELTIRASKIVGGQEFDARVLLDEDTAWKTARIESCVAEARMEDIWSFLPCHGDGEGNTASKRAGGNRPLPREPVASALGLSWARASVLPAIPGKWAVMPVKDINGHNITNKLPTGVAPSAWYTGGMCPITTGDAGNALDRSLSLLAATQAEPCLLPGEESRLVTPAFDLSTIAGESADLTFTHRYAFDIVTKMSSPEALASGGVVEIQVYDEDTKTWLPWKQLYSNPKAIYAPKDDANFSELGPVALLGPRGLVDRAIDQYRYGPVRGGYSAFTVNETRDQTGRIIRRDAPFDAVPVFDPDTRTMKEVQFLYSGKSTDVTGNAANGWVEERFSLAEYLGKTVRIGFHVSVSGSDRDRQFAAKLTNPDGDARDLAGWWITDVAVKGKVLHGAPIQLRARAATDGNVNEGYWQFDDVGVFGAHYVENVGIFVDSTQRYGGTEGQSTLIPVTIRNLGEAVRPDLAIQVRELPQSLALSIGGVEGQTVTRMLVDDQPVTLISGFSVAPGRSKVAWVNVTVPAGLSAAEVQRTLLIELRERNEITGMYDAIPFNEVQGFLQRQIEFTAQRTPLLALGGAVVVTPSPVAREKMLVAVDATNLGYSPIALDLECQAGLIGGSARVQHNLGEADEMRIAEAYPCVKTDGPGSVDARSTARLTFEITPNASGTVHIRINGTSSHDGENWTEFAKPATLAALVQRAPLLYHEGFDDEKTVLANWSADSAAGGGAPAKWSFARGNTAPGALLIGINETVAQSLTYTECQSSECKAWSKPFDLHNFTGENVQLAFWQMVRLGKYDGAQVSVVFLEDEERPLVPGAWSRDTDPRKHCVAHPRGGYDTFPPVRSAIMEDGVSTIDDPIAYPNRTWRTQGGTTESPGGGVPKFFTSGSWEESWSRAIFDLGQGCIEEETGIRRDIVGHTVRFVFTVYAGPGTDPDGTARQNTLGRTRGHGWLIDDLSLTLSNFTVNPRVAQRATMLDNTTKTFHVVIDNHAPFPDLIRFELDAGNSSAPAGAIQVSSEPVPIEANRTGLLVPVKVTLPRDPSFLPTQFSARVLARSVLDPTWYAPVDLVLDFQPRPWAELGVSVTTPNAAIQEGTETFLPITVENNGVVESVPTTVRITDAWPGGSQVTEIDLPPMPSYFQGSDEASRVLEFRWRPVRGSVGLHTLTVEVDPLHLGEEYTRQNNVLVLPLQVSELLVPDVDVSGADALRLRNAVGQAILPQKEGGVTRFESIAGELVTLEVRVRNSGRAAATNVDVRAFIGALSLPAKTVPYIGPGEEVSLTFNWVAQKGEYPLEVIARSEQVEVGTANNRNPAQGVTLLVVKGFEVSVQIPDLEGILEPGTEVRLPLNVTNTGNAGEDIRLVPRVPEGWTASVARDGLFLRAGETFTTTVTVAVPAEAVAGEQFISVDAIAVSNPMKAATASARTFVRAFYGGAVETTAVRASPPDMVLPVTLRNDGNSLEPWDVLVRLPPGWATSEAQPLRVSVPPRGTTTVDLHVKIPEGTTPGERLFGIKATLPDGTRRDGVLRVDVAELRASLVRVADDRPSEARGALAYPLVVENRGNVASPFDLVLLGAPAGVDATVEPVRFELDPGERAVATLLVRPDASVAPGAYQVEAYAAFAGVAPDTTQGRANLQRLQLTLVRPELRMAPLEYAKASLDVGERVVVKVPIENTGQAVVTDLPVHLFVDDVFMGETRIARIGPGETRDVTLNWTALPGAHTATAVVDPWKDTVDPDVADNAVSVLLTVGSAPLSGLVGGARVPLGGFALALLAALAAALVATPILGARRPPR